ncbi:UNVERIFIED_CONTAM: hypothetical protein Slati_2128100 [Sesamum latifolium]|uniref:Zinc knuckle CX2CX4HX4C domain-containing protein n=1 Tax=Sesamum latifolium TaxID=2727402 RepID=A0AAW2WQH8_9LAMI
MDESGRSWGDSLRIRVAINVTQPLVRALRVCTPMGDKLVVSFMYEWLQNFCYLCGWLGHISALCELRFDEGFQDSWEATPYGAWLRAPPGSWGVRKSLTHLQYDEILLPTRPETRRCLEDSRQFINQWNRVLGKERALSMQNQRLLTASLEKGWLKSINLLHRMVSGRMSPKWVSQLTMILL